MEKEKDPKEPTPREDYIRELRDLAQLLEDHPEVKIPSSKLYLFAHDKKELATLIRAFGPGDKGKDSMGIVFRPERFPHVEITGFHTGICERRATGRKVVVPAQEERVIPATPEREEDEFEWVCPPSLLEGDSDGE